MAGLQLARVPNVRVVSEQGVARHRASVQAHHADEPLTPTEALENLPPAPDLDPAALKASLIMGNQHVIPLAANIDDSPVKWDDQHVIPLDRTVINVGRHRENHIILDEAGVSRRHAQLRLRFGRFVLYDLGSRSGTQVNGQPVQECILQHGDVISLGGVRLIYTEDEDSPTRGLPDDSDSPYDLGETEANPTIDPSSQGE